MPRPYPLVALALAGCATAPVASDSSRAVSYQCGQTVVIGRIETHDSLLIEADDGGISWASLNIGRIQASRVLVGRRNRTSLAVRYVSHGVLRSDIDMMFVLEREQDTNIYWLKDKESMADRPRLAPACSPAVGTNAAGGV